MRAKTLDRGGGERLSVRVRGQDLYFTLVPPALHSHLIHRDYEAIVQDFVTLEFIPEGTDLRPILPVLAKVSAAPTLSESIGRK